MEETDRKAVTTRALTRMTGACTESTRVSDGEGGRGGSQGILPRGTGT